MRRKGRMLSTVEAKSRVAQWVAQSKTLRIFVFGKLGTGKSTLINSLLNQEVAKVGSGVKAVTRKVENFSGVVETIKSVPELNITIHDIDITLWDTPGLQDSEVSKGDILRDITTNISGNVDLYVYCHQMTQTRAESSDFEAIADLTEALGVDFWKMSFFALTFANNVSLPLSCKDLTLEQFFKRRVEDWKQVLHAAVLDAGVERVDVEHIPVIPTGYYNNPLPVNYPEGRWFVQFWSTCLERMRFMSIPALLTVNQDEWITHQSSDAIVARIISQRLTVLSQGVDQELDLRKIPSTEVCTYLRQCIQGHAVGEVQNRRTSVSMGCFIVLPLVGIAVYSLRKLHSRR